VLVLVGIGLASTSYYMQLYGPEHVVNIAEGDSDPHALARALARVIQREVALRWGSA